MSSATAATGAADVEEFEEFYGTYYHEDILELAQLYPREQESLYVEFDDLFVYSPDLAERWMENPAVMKETAEAALRNYDLPADVDLSGAHVRLTDTEGSPEMQRRGVGEIRQSEAGDYVAVSGQLSSVTGVMDKMTEAAFECQRCGTKTYIPQQHRTFEEPHECQGCERQGPFRVVHSESEFVDYRKLKVSQRPEETANGAGESIEVIVEDDLVDIGGKNGLADKAGKDIVIFGQIHREQVQNGRQKMPLFKHYMRADAVHFENTELEEINPEEHLEEIREHANADDAIERFADSIAPSLYKDATWDMAFRLGTAYLFAAPRIDPRGGPSYRGDIHGLLIGDPGRGKSKFISALADISPDCEFRSATGLSSEVGLTAAATKDDFGEGQFSLSPGILARAGWHAIIDEIDKGPEELTRINDALEGDQVISVDKAGISAELNSRVGLMASGNPKHGRFNDHDPIKEQIDIAPSLFSRFDGIVVLRDQADPDMDEKIGNHIGKSWREADEMERNGGTLTDDMETLQAPVSTEVARAWVKYAREEYRPSLSKDAVDQITEFYTEVRNEIGDEDAIAATPRNYEAALRYAVAFARLRLHDKVQEEDVEEAIQLSRDLIGQTHDGDLGGFDVDMFTEATEKAQRDRIQTILKLVREMGPVPMGELKDAAAEEGIDGEHVSKEMDKLRTRGEVYEDSPGVYKSS